MVRVGKYPEVEKWMSGGCDGNSSEKLEESTSEKLMVLFSTSKTNRLLMRIRIEVEAK
jgi:hypothetical protein